MFSPRNGHSKGIAFVEYKLEADASSAVIKSDKMKIKGQVIEVALSNPPEKRTDRGKGAASSVKSLGGTSREALNAGPRGKGRTQVAFVPRSVAKASTGNGNAGCGEKQEKKPVKSNDEFRAMLLGNK